MTDEGAAITAVRDETVFHGVRLTYDAGTGVVTAHPESGTTLVFAEPPRPALAKGLRSSIADALGDLEGVSSINISDAAFIGAGFHDASVDFEKEKRSEKSHVIEAMHRLRSHGFYAEVVPGPSSFTGKQPYFLRVFDERPKS